MKIIMPNGQTWEEFKKEWDEEEEKKNLRNFINAVFPRGIADYNAFYALTHPWIIVKHWLREIKYAQQRAFRGWDDTAVWSIDFYLAHLIPQLVRKLKDDGIGYPCSLLPENYDFDEPDKEKRQAASDVAIKKWEEILDDIADGFEQYEKYDGFKWESDRTEHKVEYKKFQKAFGLLRKYFGALWD